MSSTELLERTDQAIPNSLYEDQGGYNFDIPLQQMPNTHAESTSAAELGVFDENGFNSGVSIDNLPQVSQEQKVEDPGTITEAYQGRHASPYTTERYQGDRQSALLFEPEGILEPGYRQMGYIPRHAAQPKLESLATPQVEQTRAQVIGHPLMRRVVSVFSHTKYLEGRSFTRRPRWKY